MVSLSLQVSLGKSYMFCEILNLSYKPDNNTIEQCLALSRLNVRKTCLKI